MTQPNNHNTNSVEMPTPTAWPIVLAMGVTLVASGFVTSLALSVVGAFLLLVALVGWIGQLLPGQGHMHEPLVDESQRPQPATPQAGTVEQLRPGMPGHRFRLPEKVHPISAGVKGGIVGGLLMPIPALLYGLLSGHGIWLPINFLAGMVIPGFEDRTIEQLEAFSFAAFLVGLTIHVIISLSIGLVYGVLLADATADSGRAGDLGRSRHAALVDGVQLPDDGRDQPRAAGACELVLLRPLAVSLRPRGVDRGDPVGKGGGAADGKMTG